MNKRLGNNFESELANLLFTRGCWVTLLRATDSGQPADMIAATRHETFLIDCKVCSKDVFDLRRIEDNQVSAMKLWWDRTSSIPWFALKFSDESIYFLSFHLLKKLKNQNVKSIAKEDIVAYGFEFDKWVSFYIKRYTW